MPTPKNEKIEFGFTKGVIPFLVESKGFNVDQALTIIDWLRAADPLVLLSMANHKEQEPSPVQNVVDIREATQVGYKTWEVRTFDIRQAVVDQIG